MRKRPKSGTLADLMLRELETRYPGGPTTSELARLLYEEDTLENRAKVRGVARTIRKWGYRAYGFGGTYKLCDADPEGLSLVFVRTLKMACGVAESAGEVAEGIDEAGDPVRASEAKCRLKEALLDLASKL